MIEFGPFRYDPEERLLYRDDNEIVLPMRVVAVLESFLKRPGQIVRKDDILASAWEGAFVGEDSLTQAVSQLRRALGDDPNAPTFIQTIPRRGYRFISEVSAPLQSTIPVPRPTREDDEADLVPERAEGTGRPPTFVPGATVGRFELKARIGAGAMGEVWRALDTGLRRDVAIKVVPQELAREAAVIERFRREALMLAAVNHPNIATIHGVEQVNGTPFIVMELLEGETLQERLERGALPIDEARAIAVQITRALEVAHDAGIVHRDLKPGNIMLGADGQVKVLDFGLAKDTRSEDGAVSIDPTTLTATGLPIGTAAYMSPEQAAGKPIDKRSDIFSFGCVLFEMLAGQRPFGGTTASEIVACILKDEPEWDNLPSTVPRSTRRLLRRCLAKDADRRVHDIADARIEMEEESPGGAVSWERAAARATRAVAAGPTRRPHRRWTTAGIAGVAVVAAAFLYSRPGDPPPTPTEAAYPRTAIAVLPFQNLSADQGNAFFAGGLHDELLTQLSRVEALSLRARTSVMGYAGTTKSIRQIGEELQVGTLVLGSVQVVGERLRVTIQLIDVATDEHLLARTYDRTLDEAFAIQSDVAQRVADELGAELMAADRQALAQAPTADDEAYLLYLQGLEYYRRPGYLPSNWEMAQQLYDRALVRDPEFALAHAALSYVHGDMHWFGYDTSPQRMARQRDAAEASLRFGPDLPQAHVAMGMWYYEGRRNYGAALEEFEVARRGLPNDAEIWELIGYVNRRLGNWNAVFSAFDRARELDPRDPNLFGDLGGVTLLFLRRFPEAIEAFDRALVLAPDLHDTKVQKGWTYARWQGRLDPLRTVLENLPDQVEIGGWFGTGLAQRAELLHWERQADSLLQLVATANAQPFSGQLFFLPASLYAGWAHELRRDRAAAQAAFASALAVLDGAFQETPDDFRVRAARGLALAGLGRRDEALREAQWLEESPIYREDAYFGRVLAEYRAQILARAGEAQMALDELDRLLAGPSLVSVHTLRLDPRWDPIRDHPGFQALLVKYGG